MAIRDYIRQRPPIAQQSQADSIIPDPDIIPINSASHIATMDAWGVPDDLPVPVSERNGVFVPATGTESGLIDYNPWTWAQPAQILDWSRPAIGPYGEPSSPGKAGTLVAEWGGMPSPVRDYQDTTDAVLYSPRQVNYHQSHGPAGAYFGGSQTAWEASAQTPTPDYWSTIILKG